MYRMEVLPGMVTTQEAAELLHCDVSHVRRLARAGLLRERAITPRWRVYERASVEHYAANRPKRGWPKGRPRKPTKEGDDGREN